MKLHELSPSKGSKKVSHRVGRGAGSGWGKTSGRGHKGQNSRSGSSTRPGFEGGQMPLQRRIPKRGFSNAKFAEQIAIVNVETLSNNFKDGDVVDTAVLLESGFVKQELDGIKVLGKGDIDKKLTVKANAFSKTAIEKIEQAGGKVEVV